MVQNKKAMSEVVGTMLFIVLTLSAVVIIYAIAQGILKSAKSEIKAKEAFLLNDITLENVYQDGDIIKVTLSIELYSEVSDVEFIVSSSVGRKEVFLKKDLGQELPAENSKREYNITNVSTLGFVPTEVGIALQFNIGGKEIISDIKNTKPIGTPTASPSPVASPTPTPPEDDLVAHWRFDEGSGTTASDSSGNGNNGVLIGNPVWILGKAKYALQFDGIDDRADAGNNASINSGANYQPFTYTAWVNPTNASRNVFIINKGDSITGYMQVRMQTIAGGYLYFGWRNNTWELLTSNASIQSNNWSHVAFVYDGSNQFIYINGIQRGTRVASLPPPSRSTYLPNLLIGGYVYNSINSSLNGTLDEVRIYNRTLSSAEINTLYSQGL